jgi:hypothetical protein
MSMFIVPVNIKYCLVIFTQMFKHSSKFAVIMRYISGDYTNGAGGLTGPIKLGMRADMQVRNKVKG